MGLLTFRYGAYDLSLLVHVDRIWILFFRIYSHFGDCIRPPVEPHHVQLAVRLSLAHVRATGVLAFKEGERYTAYGSYDAWSPPRLVCQ